MIDFTPKTIEEVSEAIIDYRGKTPEKTATGVRLITAKVIKDGFIINENNEFIAEDKYDEWMRRGLPKQGDILITTEAPLGEVAQLRTSERIALAQRVILLRGKPSIIDQEFFFHALKSRFVQGQLMARSSGTTVLGIKQSELRQVQIPCYPIPTQRKIAAILSAYDDLIENNTRRIKILEEMARMIYREWFVRFRFPGHENVRMVDSPLGLIPEGWAVKGAREAVEINPATKVPREGEKPFVPMGSLCTDSMLISNVEMRSGNNGSKFRNGDTLFARITPCLENGKTSFVQFLPSEKSVGFGSTEFIVLRSKSLCPEFVYLLARSDEFRANAIKSMTGATGRQRVQEACFERFLFAHPDRGAIQIFAEKISPLFRVIHLLAQKNVILHDTREMLILKLFTGEIDIERQELDPEVLIA